jgi:FkbM family methyltransferase
MDTYVGWANEFWLRHYQPKEGDVIVDIGAGRGEDTLAFSRGVGNSGRVLAIEAHPPSFALLKRFCSLNGIANVTALHLALMDKPGTVRIKESESIWSENAIAYDESGVEVPADTLENVSREQGLGTIDFLKMNIEGAERYALPGMALVMPRIRQICVACHDFRADQGHGEQFRTREFVEQFLTMHGFTLSRRSLDPRDYVRDHVFGLRSA